jgi:hypothetical protein
MNIRTLTLCRVMTVRRSPFTIGTVTYLGARGGAVVEALRYKPEGRGIDFRWCHWNLSLTIFLAALRPWS